MSTDRDRSDERPPEPTTVLLVGGSSEIGLAIIRGLAADRSVSAVSRREHCGVAAHGRRRASDCRAQDALSLWHLLQRVDPSLRGAVYDRLAALMPPPTGVTRRGALALESRSLEGYWTKIRRIHFRLMILRGVRQINPRTGLAR